MMPLAHDIVAFCRVFAMFEREMVCCGTVSVAQCVLLQTLREGPQDVSSLARELSVTNGAVTRLVDGLEKRDYVIRHRDADDRRRVHVTLTDAGEAEAQRLIDLTEQAIRSVLVHVPADRIDDVADVMKLLRRAMDQVPMPS